MHPMQTLLEPSSIAVIGASETEGKTGYILMKNLVDNGYKGGIYPINPNAMEIFGYRTYRTVLDVPHEIDLAFLLIPGQLVNHVLVQCGEKNVKSAVIVSAGFAEVGEHGLKAQSELEDVIRKSGIRCIGPNTIGLVNKQKNLLASFVPFQNWKDGPVAIGAQSGIFAGALATELMEMKTQRFGVCKSLSFGNMIDLDETDFLEYAWRDPASKIIAFYLERIKRPRPFFSLANKIKKEKPIIILKSGRTEYGGKAALSHTGSMPIKDNLLDIAFRQYGIVRTYTLQEFLATLKAFAYQPLPQGNKVGVITFSGASGVMASDEIHQSGLKLARFTQKTLKKIRNILPEWQPIHNPADIWVALGIERNKAVYKESVQAVLEDENTDILLCILLALPNSDVPDIREVFEPIVEKHYGKPIFVVIIGGKIKERWTDELEGLNIPIYSETSVAVKAIRSMFAYYRIKAIEAPNPS